MAVWRSSSLANAGGARTENENTTLKKEVSATSELLKELVSVTEFVSWERHEPFPARIVPIPDSQASNASFVSVLFTSARAIVLLFHNLLKGFFRSIKKLSSRRYRGSSRAPTFGGSSFSEVLDCAQVCLSYIWPLPVLVIKKICLKQQLFSQREIQNKKRKKKA